MFGDVGGSVGAMGATVREVFWGLPAAAKASTFDLVDADMAASWLILLHIPLFTPAARSGCSRHGCVLLTFYEMCEALLLAIVQ